MKSHTIIRFYTVALFVLVSTCVSLGQDFIPTDANRNALELVDLERAYRLWSQDVNLDETKGWKWYQRWLEEELRNSTLHKGWPHRTNYLKEAVELSKTKTSQSRSAGTWMPVGPSTFPTIPGGNLFRGMGRINTVAFHPTDPNTIFVGVAQGGVWKSTNSGQTWMPLTDDLPVIRINDIAIDPTDPDIMYVCVGDYAYVGASLETDSRKRNTHYGLGIYKTTDGGLTWEPTGLTFDQLDRDASLMRRVFINPNNNEELLAAGISGVFRSLDGGNTWDKTLDQVMSDFEQDEINGNIIYASSFRVNVLDIGQSAIWKTTDFGGTWTQLNINFTGTNAQRVELAIAPSNNQVVYALVANSAGGFFGLYRSSNAGLTWTLQSSEPNILHWYGGTSGGGQGTYDLAIMVDADNADLIYTGGINMWGSEDGGINWKRASFWLPQYGSSLHADHHFYKYNPLDEYYYACHDGGINRTKEIFLYTQTEMDVPGFSFETQWEDISAGMEITSFYRMDVSKIHVGDVVAGSQDNSNFIKRDTQWLNVVLGDGMDCFFHPSNGNIAYVSTQGGNLRRTNDRGDSFIGGLTSDIRSIETGGWTTPFESDPHNSDGIYAAFGNVWYSSNRGDDWTQLTDFSPVPGSDFILPGSSLTIAPSNPNRFYVAKRPYPAFSLPGELWTTANGGGNMINRTAGLPSSLFITSTAVHELFDTYVIVTVGGFEDGSKVFKSVDAGLTWENISGNLPNIPINSIELRPNSETNEMYIATDIGVYVRSDVTNDWQLFSQGLPNVIVSDLVIDVTNDLLYASTFGRGIWASDLAVLSSSTNQELSLPNIQIVPNPNKGVFGCVVSNFNSEDAKIRIVDITGRQVYNGRKQIRSGQLTFNLNLLSGTYFLRIEDGQKASVARFIIN